MKAIARAIAIVFRGPFARRDKVRPKPPDREQIDRLREKYLSRGIMYHRQFLLPPEHAILLARDLAAMGVVIWGCDLWDYLDREMGYLAELLGAGCGVTHDREATLTAEEGAAMVEHHIRGLYRGDADLVWLSLRDFDLYDWFV